MKKLIASVVANIYSIIKRLAKKNPPTNSKSKIQPPKKGKKDDVTHPVSPDPNYKYRKGHKEEVKTGKPSKERLKNREETQKEHKDYAKPERQITDKKQKNNWTEDLDKKAANKDVGKELSRGKGEIKDASTSKLKKPPELSEPSDKMDSVIKPVIGVTLAEKLVSDKAEALETIEENLEPNSPFIPLIEIESEKENSKQIEEEKKINL